MSKVLCLILSLFLILGCSSTKRVVESSNEDVSSQDTLKTISDTSLTQLDTMTLQEDTFEVAMERRIVRVEGSSYEVLNSVEKSIKKPKVKYEVRIDTTAKLDSGYGVITYFVPDTMRIDKAYVITLRISNEYASLKNLNENQSGRVVVDKIRIGSTMKAFLSDIESAFEVKELSTTEQCIELGKDYTEWQWSVKPKKGGNKKMKIRVSMSGPVNKDFEVFNDTIHVEVPTGYNVGNFFKEHWQWLISTLILPFGLWLYNRRKKKSESTPKRKRRKK